ncbi:hypothetical protein AN191_03940 [Loktanella sp. 5RATIMAR09]|uniref:hypothetical protein n=1 Tax=Loktanella sp. 5RATIMAR09 TaxID=1225655 RepID=UPI0006EBDD09|nr:hypothetical protein [Loktanella sp. 5RATIMAR09]KQI73056.1 hypothetical protein AN191_03940 [Loktanella sp. 5RATIMAR09]
MTTLNILFFLIPAMVFLIILAVAYFKIRPDRPTRFDEDINQAAQQAWQAGREDAQVRSANRGDG